MAVQLAGEHHFAQQIREAAARGSLGHAVIISGRGDLTAAARFTAAAMECEGAGERPCGECGPCRKVLKGTHPDVITVEDPEHKNIAVEILRQKVADAYVLPNEGKRKIYCFPDCGLLDPKAQNVLLKVLEEGPAHAAFLFCAENSAALLPTVRSRAVEWKLAPAPEDVFSTEARKLCALLCEGKAPAVLNFCVELENSKVSREELKNMLSSARDLLTAALASCYTGGGEMQAQQLAGGLGRRRLAAYIEILEGFARQCDYNINVGHLTGALAAALTSQLDGQRAAYRGGPSGLPPGSKL